MKKLISVISFLLMFSSAFSQGRENPVVWSFSSKKIDDKTFELYFIAKIDDLYHIYDSKPVPGDIYQPTTFTFYKNPLVEVVGDTMIEIGKPRPQKDSDGSRILGYFYEDYVSFIKIVKVKGDIKTNISGVIDYMACTRTHCLPPMKRRFSLSLE